MKKVLSAVLCAALLLTVLSPMCFAEALPLSAGLDELREQFVFGIGPNVNGTVMDYYYYEPEGDASAETEVKYPVVVWLHGLVSGGYPGRQITKNDISYWASEEFQSRFTEGGAYIFAPRSPEAVAAWADTMLEPLKKTIDSFIADHYDTADASRIYLGGLSMGGKMVLKMAAEYPEMFAALFPCSPYYSLSNDVAEGVKDVPIWQLSSKSDIYMGYNTWIKKDWNRLMAASRRKEDCRITVFDTALKPDGSRPGTTHDTWYAATYDMFMEDNSVFTGSVTYNGYGEEVPLTYPEGMISWLCRYSSDYSVKKPNRDPVSSAFYRIYTRIMAYFADLIRRLGIKGVLG